MISNLAIFTFFSQNSDFTSYSSISHNSIFLSQNCKTCVKHGGHKLPYWGHKISCIKCFVYSFHFHFLCVCVYLYSSSWKCHSFLFFVCLSIVNANFFLYSLTFIALLLSHCVFYEFVVHLNDAYCQSPFNSWRYSCEKFNALWHCTIWIVWVSS